ncbi:30S ribosomal protein S17 [bacterium]
MEKSKRKIIVGNVVSDAMDKSRVVLVTRKVKHPLYSKIIKRSTKFMIHDEKNESKKGDIVEFYHFRPISKNKCFKLSKVIKKAV